MLDRREESRQFQLELACVGFAAAPFADFGRTHAKCRRAK
jgi:hypothetical protein